MRQCCINNCSSQGNNLFKFPNNEQERNLWLTAIKHYLKNKLKDKILLYICKKHFPDDCFYDATYKILVDGKEIEIQRKKDMLRKKSVPSIFQENSENNKTNNLEKPKANSEATDVAPLKIALENRSGNNSANRAEKTITIKTEALDFNSSEGDKKSRIKRKREPKNTQEKVKSIKLEKQNHSENPSQSETSVSKFPQFTFANSFHNDIQCSRVKCETVKTVSQSSASDCDKVKKTVEKLNISNDSENFNEVPIDAESKKPVLHSSKDISDKINLKTNDLQSTTTATEFPRFTFANSDTGTNRPKVLILKNNVETVIKPTIKNTLHINPGTNQLLPIVPNRIMSQNGSVQPAIKNILKLNPGTNQMPSAIPNRIMSQNGSVQPAIKNVLKLNPGTNQMPPAIPISSFPNYTFAARPKPSSPNCTEILILKRLNPIDTKQLNRVVTFSPVPNLNSSNNGIANVNNSTVKLPASGMNSIQISNTHSVNPASSQSRKRENESTAKNENVIPKPLESNSHRTKKSKHERDLSPASIRRINIANEIMALNSTLPPKHIFGPVTNSSSANHATVKYSKAALMRDWNYRLVDKFPKYWGMIDSPEGVFFGYVGDTPNIITRSIFVRDDMSVELRAQNQVANCPVIENIENLEHLRIAMIKIVSMNLCASTLEGQCNDGFYVRKMGTSSDRCKECQKKRRNEQHNTRIKSQRLSLKEENRRKNLHNLKNKLRRSLKKIEDMQRAYEELSMTLIKDE